MRRSPTPHTVTRTVSQRGDTLVAYSEPIAWPDGGPPAAAKRFLGVGKASGRPGSTLWVHLRLCSSLPGPVACDALQAVQCRHILSEAEKDTHSACQHWHFGSKRHDSCRSCSGPDSNCASVRPHLPANLSKDGPCMVRARQAAVMLGD